MKLILLGAPGAGKGTQAEVIAERLSIPIISTGNILKEAVRNETELGKQAKGYMDCGKLVPDEVIIGIIKERLRDEDCAGGFILDGVPRTIAHAEALEGLGVIVDKVVSIEAPEVENVCDKCGETLVTRSDDEESTVVTRLKVYHESTEQLKDYYRAKGKLRTVDGMGSIADTTRAILAALEE